MMKQKTYSVVGLLSFLFIFTITTFSSAGIIGSKHDFSGEGWSNNPDNEICIPCHTPHNADKTLSDGPLWHHELSVATYTLYDSTTLDATMEQPNSISKLCLSCHDGTVALESYGTHSGSTFLDSGDASIGTDLSDDHPVSFRWEHQTVSTCTLDCHFGNGDPYSYTVRFYNHRVECSTCHDPHNNSVPGPGDKMLRMSMVGSELCLLCHNGK